MLKTIENLSHLKLLQFFGVHLLQFMKSASIFSISQHILPILVFLNCSILLCHLLFCQHLVLLGFNRAEYWWLMTFIWTVLFIAINLLLRGLYVFLNITFGLGRLTNKIFAAVALSFRYFVSLDYVVKVRQVMFSGVCNVRSLPNLFYTTLLDLSLYLMEILKVSGAFWN